MNLSIKALATALCIAALLTACKNNSESKTETTTSTSDTTTHNADHVFACPMHPEVTGKEGDDCPKCGMKLEHNDNAGLPSNVTMQFTATPASPKANEAVTLSMTPRLKDNATEQVPLDVEHTKKIHLIAVSEDLSWFDHIHPELNADGSYSVSQKFPFAGKYTLFADYKPTGANHTVDYLTVDVAGTKPAPKLYSADKLAGDGGDGFTVKLTSASGKFLTNAATEIKGVVMLNGKEVDVNTLEDYLGAKAHMVVVSLDDKKYLHVHPGVDGAKFALTTTFEKPGVYRGWIQYQSKGKVHTSDFVFNVAQGSAQDKAAKPAGDMKDMNH